MKDDQIDVKQFAGEEASDSTPSVEETKATEKVETTPVKTEATAEVETEGTQTETEEGSKKGANARIRELNAKAKSAEERAKSLEDKLAELTAPVGVMGQQVPQFNPQEPVINPGEEIDVSELNRRLALREQRLLAQADARADLRNKQTEAISRINLEANQAIKTYPELDPDSDSFDKELSDSVTEATIAYVQSNPYSASPKKFVDKLMRPYKRAVTKEVGKASENIAKQVSQAALRPTAVTTRGEKDDSELTITELEKKYGIVY